MKIIVAIPTYDRKLHVEVVRSLLNEQAAAAMIGDELMTVFAPGCSVINHARNQVAREVEKYPADKIVMLDADVSWEVGHLLKLAHNPADFVGGAYRYKDEKEGYPVGWLKSGEELARTPGPWEVSGLPGGFIAITPHVLARLREVFPRRNYKYGGESFWAFFESPFQYGEGDTGELLGEDNFFSITWRQTGGKVLLDPDLILTHWEGGNRYKGCIRTWLKEKAV